MGDISAFGFYSTLISDDISPFIGDISPFIGDISPFSDDIAPFLSDDISPFMGDISPFIGDISPFYGDISPFWGDIAPFWGDISPFTVTGFSDDISPFMGDISPFHGDINPFWGDIAPFEDGDPLAAHGGLTDYWKDAGVRWGQLYQDWAVGISTDRTSRVTRDLGLFLEDTAAVWGELVAERTGTGFFEGFATPLLEKYGIDLNDHTSLEKIDGATRSAFFLDFYDGLMSYIGTDHVDHWMATANWRPLITQEQGMGAHAKVGLIDMKIATTDNNIEYLVDMGGYDTKAGSHGAAVASLIGARHDAQGIMGVAPHATVYAYNPFDGTGTTNPDDVMDGVRRLVDTGVHVINMSMGIPGYTLHQDIADIFGSWEMSRHEKSLSIVLAAGNEGVSQTGEIVWNGWGSSPENILVVGSVTPTGWISAFSNRPGDACFVSRAGGRCEDGERLMDRFLVAPGELLLASDNQGGVERVTGTSFAAPLVTGTIALLHDRWPWLENYAAETTDIILRSARDLGEPGVDPVYGHGLLDVEASQSPLDFNDLVIYRNSGGRLVSMSADSLAEAMVTPGTLDLWDLKGVSIYAIEDIGRTSRDFSIPLSTLLVGTNDWYGEAFQSYAFDRLHAWAAERAGSNVIGSTVGSVLGFGSVPSFSFEREDGTFSAVAGQGFGAQFLGTETGYLSSGDYDPYIGGMNPLLGIASGGSYGRMTFSPAKDMALSMGITSTAIEQLNVDPVTGVAINGDTRFGTRDAVALNADLTMQAHDRITLGASLTSLQELNGALGAQGAGALAFEGGAQTNALTLTSTFQVAPKISFVASMTGGHTRALEGNSTALTVANEGILSTAFHVEMQRRDLFKGGDRLSLSFAQPLHTEGGALAFTSVQVVDRATGTLGETTQEWALGGTDRQLAWEGQYALPLRSIGGEVGAYARHDFNVTDQIGVYDETSMGLRFSFEL